MPSVQDNLPYRRTWKKTCAALLHASARAQTGANRHCTAAPAYALGQQVWLSTWNIPLKVDSKKLSPRFIGPFVIDRVLNPSAVRLKLTASLHVHPIFHVSQIKPVQSSALSPPLQQLLLPLG